MFIVHIYPEFQEMYGENCLLKKNNESGGVAHLYSVGLVWKWALGSVPSTGKQQSQYSVKGSDVSPLDLKHLPVSQLKACCMLLTSIVNLCS